MFNFKTKMTEIIKTEKWSSLRLDFQQFTPQEYCDSCPVVTTYEVTVSCVSLGYLSYDPDGSGIFQHNNHTHTETLSFTQSPQLSNIVDRLGASVGYTSSHGNKGQFKQNRTSGYIYGTSNHFFTSGSYTTTARSSMNVSG